MRYTVFGESHGVAVGVVAEGFHPGEPLDEKLLLRMMERRAPGGILSSGRREPDEVEILSGVYRGKTTGDPVCLIIRNRDAASEDYAALADLPRPSHGDYVVAVKSGGYNDARGGGHLSGRLTAPVTALGALALSALATHGVAVGAHLLHCGGVHDTPFADVPPTETELEELKKRDFPTRSTAAGEEMQRAIRATAEEGDSLGATVEGAVLSLPVGLGDRAPEQNLQSRLARELFSLPGVKAVSFGAGEAFASLRGSEANDPFGVKGGRVLTETNRSGGVNAGMANGMPLLFSVTFRPTPSIGKTQRTVDLRTGEETHVSVKGRHDPCIAVRAVAAVEAAAALALYDLFSPTPETPLAALRREIDAADAALFRAFSRRMELARAVGAYKKENGLPVRDEARESTVIESRKRMADGAFSDAAEELTKVLLRLSREEQER